MVCASPTHTGQPFARAARSPVMLNEAQVAEVFKRLSAVMPGRTRGAKGPKGQPDAFRSCISCMLSAQSLDRNTAKATSALFSLATTPEDKAGALVGKPVVLNISRAADPRPPLNRIQVKRLAGVDVEVAPTDRYVIGLAHDQLV